MKTTSGVPAHAQGDEWETLNNEAVALYSQGHYDRAVVVAKKALEVAEQEIGADHPNVAASLNSLALLYKTQGQYAPGRAALQARAGDPGEGARPEASLLLFSSSLWYLSFVTPFFLLAM